MAKPAARTARSEKLALYDKLVATNPDVERKGATVPYTSINGHMFSYLSNEGKLALRLSTDLRDAFLKSIKRNCARPMAWFSRSMWKCLTRCLQPRAN